MAIDRKILVYGYGNPGRQDDGLGNEFVNRLENWIQTHQLSGIEVDSNYQLNIEDAAVIADKDIVIFVDASVESIEDFALTRVLPADSHIEFTMHACSSSFVLDLCNKIYGKNPETFLLHIKGYEWGFVEQLSSKAISNLEKALDFCKNLLLNPDEIAKSVS